LTITSRNYTLVIIIPTFNEVDNVSTIVDRLHKTLKEFSWEVIFIDDDSPDGTSFKLKEISKKYSNVRFIRRIGRRGLSSACLEGILASKSDLIAVMDADLQHDEKLLPQMYDLINTNNKDLVIGSRYTKGGEIDSWNINRKRGSLFATFISKKLLGIKLKDPMSGFFMIKRSIIEDIIYDLSSIGFKVLLDIIISLKRPIKIVELPYSFGVRKTGESKLDNKVIWDFLLLIIDKKIGKFLPVRFISFAIIGSFGVIVHLIILISLKIIFPENFTFAQSSAVVTSMIFNFILNNALTYRDQRLTGISFFFGMVKFMFACSIGALSNVGIASFIYFDSGNWLFSGLAGIIVGLIWNYGATSVLVWSKQGQNK